MNTTTIEGNWNEEKGRLKEKFVLLTNNDPMFEKGKKDEMFERLQAKLGKTKEELKKLIAALNVLSL